MQYQVPQFIEVEDKILSFLTVRQFVYLFITGVIIGILYFLLNTALWTIVALVIGGIAAGFTFIQYNGRPMSSLIWSVFLYYWLPRTYVWKRKEELEALRRDAADRAASSPLQSLWLRITAGTAAIPQRETLLPKKFFGGGQERYTLLRKTTGDAEVAKRIDYR